MSEWWWVELPRAYILVGWSGVEQSGEGRCTLAVGTQRIRSFPRRGPRRPSAAARLHSIQQHHTHPNLTHPTPEQRRRIWGAPLATPALPFLIHNPGVLNVIAGIRLLPLLVYIAFPFTVYISRHINELGLPYIILILKRLDRAMLRSTIQGLAGMFFIFLFLF